MSFSELLDAFRGKRALVVGDLMLDEYHFGRAERISPEAPVMVIRHQRSAQVPGGAANVALNLQALGAVPTLIGVAGDDVDGDALEHCLRDAGLNQAHLFREVGRPTTKKTRIVADHSHQVLRLDFESDRPLDPSVEDRVIEAIQSAAGQADVVVLSDYLKGVCSAKLVERTLHAAARAGIPAVANPKPASFTFYRQASLVSLNRLEAAHSIGPMDGPHPEEALKTYRKSANLGPILVTLGGEGMVASGSESFHVEAPKVEVYDTAGAGDTVIATVALGMATAGFVREVFELAAQTAACVVRHVGVATPSQSDLAAIRAM